MITQVLVTGGAGYLGSVLCERLLDAGYNVTVLHSLIYQQNSLFHLPGCLGARLRPKVSDRPKILAEVGARPFLAYWLDQLAAAGCRTAVLSTGYLGTQVERAFGKNYGPLRLVYSQEQMPLGTGGGLRLALSHLESDPVLVMNGDSYCDLDVEAFWHWHCVQQAAASLALKIRYARIGIDFYQSVPLAPSHGRQPVGSTRESICSARK